MPDIDNPIGGVKQLYRHVEHLCSTKINSFIVTEQSDYRPSWFDTSAPTVSFDDIFNSSATTPDNTIIVLPETYSTINFANFRGRDLSGYSYVIFNQNVYYSFNGLPTDSALNKATSFYGSKNLLHVMCVSEDNHRFISSILKVPDSKLSRIVNAIESHFSPSSDKTNTIHWMPRKNPNEVQNVVLGLQCLAPTSSKGWNAFPLEALSHRDISEHLNKAKIFLSFGHPEGFGLPIAEAMASGCWVIGYSGMGGNELFSFGGSTKINFGDWNTFLSSINTTLLDFKNRPSYVFERLIFQSKAIKSLYNNFEEKRSIHDCWDKIIDSFNEWKTL